MSGFNCWVTNLISDDLPFYMYSFPKIRNILFQKAVGKEIITPIQSVLIPIVFCFFFLTRQHFLHVFSEAENAILIMGPQNV